MDNNKISSHQLLEDLIGTPEDFDDDGEEEFNEWEESQFDEVEEFNQRRPFVESHSHITPHVKPIFTKEMLANLTKTNQCTICWEEEDLLDLDCGHCFCRTCLEQYLKIEIQERKIKHERCSVNLGEDYLELSLNTLYGVVCPHLFCNFVVENVGEYLRKKEIEFFEDRCLDEALLEMRIAGELQPCPLGCGYFVQDDCLCVNLSCRKIQLKLREKEARKLFNKEEVKRKHEELIRSMLMAKKKKCCPKCYVEIVKNGGCDHMYCVICRTNFSWMNAPAYGIGASWYFKQRVELFGESKKKSHIHNSTRNTMTSPFKRRKAYKNQFKEKKDNTEIIQ